MATSELLLKAELELIKFKREQAVSGTFMSPDSPTITLMDQQIAALSQQVAQLQSQLASDRANAKAASGILAKFDELELARMFAERMFLIAQAAYEETRVSTERQEVFFVTFVRPTLPEKPMYPRRTVNTLLIFCGLFLTWSTLQLIIAGVKDHMI